ncbi:MAG TPA: hypothetical protein PL110_04725 [Candidatus Eremiobacteraeota bacterium]|nr:MAG: hypothetical protein BWY64_01474 [bacterium ADurb.Bin363]HPZ07394.1 hypothetical protein [Candidatus Eremiobacteraeota bacterium]
MKKKSIEIFCFCLFFIFLISGFVRAIEKIPSPSAIVKYHPGDGIINLDNGKNSVNCVPLLTKIYCERKDIRNAIQKLEKIEKSRYKGDEK